MLLNKLRARLRPDEDAERGAVLIAVIGVSATIMIVCALIASSSVTSATFSTITRAQLQARAAAEAGIDLVWAGIEGGTLYCELSALTASGLEFDAEVEYFDENGDPLDCIGASTVIGTPATGVVTSVGTAEAGGVGSSESANERTVIGFFDIVINDNQATLDEVFFSDGSYTITNSTTIFDGTGQVQANLYSNESVECNTANIIIQGSVYVQGDFWSTNRCQVAGTVWAGGSVTSDNQMSVGGDVLSAGGTGVLPTDVSLDKAWVGGNVVANGDISLKGALYASYCSLVGYDAKVCGNVVSIEGGIAIDNGAKVAGDAMAYNTVDLGITNAALIVGGSVVSTTGSLLAKNYNASGYRIGGYAALGSSSQLPKTKMGNAASACSTSPGFTLCNPANPAIPLGGLPPVLNFPTNTRVVAPPRQSLPQINSDGASLSLWTGWTIEPIDCAAVTPRIEAGWTGKLLLNVSGCTAPIDWGNKDFVMPGDLIVMNPSGFKAQTDYSFTSNSASIWRTMMLIVPSDGKLADGTTDLVTWTNPVATDPSYFKPTCASGEYGDILAAKITTLRVETFIYTPCQFVVATRLDNFHGQVYSGDAEYPNNSSITFVEIDVPGAVNATAEPPGPPVTATQTARFDARG